MEKKQVKQVVNGMKKSAYTKKQVCKQLSGMEKIQLKERKVTPNEAWTELGVPHKGSVIKACDVWSAWSPLLKIDGDVLIRTKDSTKIEIDGKMYALFDESRKAVKYYGWHRMVNDADVDKERGDVKVTASRLLDGLFDSKYAQDALDEASKSCDKAEKVAKGWVDMSEKPNEYHQWTQVARDDNGNWSTVDESESKPTATAKVA